MLEILQGEVWWKTLEQEGNRRLCLCYKLSVCFQWSFLCRSAGHPEDALWVLWVLPP